MNDRDDDGIEDSIDTQPDEYSDEFVYEDGTIAGEIEDRAGNTVTVEPNDNISFGSKGKSTYPAAGNYDLQHKESGEWIGNGHASDWKEIT